MPSLLRALACPGVKDLGYYPIMAAVACCRSNAVQLAPGGSMRSVFIVAVILLVGCKNPLHEGCKYATGLTEKCGVERGGDWFKVPHGFSAEDLGDEATETENRAVEQLEALTQSPQVPETETDAGPAAKRPLDSLEQYAAATYLLHYTDGNSPETCIMFDDAKRKAAYELLTSRDQSGYYNFLSLGTRSSLSSKVFESTFFAADVRGKLEAEFKQRISDSAKAKLAADAAFSAMTQNIRSEFSAGVYRYLVLKNKNALWGELARQGLLKEDCRGKKKSVSLGIVLVALHKNTYLSEKTLGINFE
ncbi:hypothetical protein EON82_22975, partial [bacterium]